MSYTITQERRDLSQLDERFAPFFNSGERVEVVWKEGYELNMLYSRGNGRYSRFFVGQSTGRMPVYIMLARRDSSGGMAILSDAVAAVRGLGVYR